MTVLDFVLLARTYRDLGPAVVGPLEAMLAGRPALIQGQTDIDQLGQWLGTAKSLGLQGVEAPEKQLADLRCSARA